MRASIWMPLREKKVRPVITRLTTRVATASSLVCRLNSAHQRWMASPRLRRGQGAGAGAAGFGVALVRGMAGVVSGISLGSEQDF